MEKRSKKEQKLQAKTLTQMFEKIEHDKELIPVVLQRGDWEALHYSIGLALKKNALPTK
jgi:hypothetical protein